MRRSSVARSAIGVGAAAALGVSLLGGVAAAAPPGASAPDGSSPVVVVSGLNNPRQLALVDQTRLLVAEAGRGGPTEVADADPDGGSLFVGRTGSISLVSLPHQARDQQPHRIVTGLLSGAGPDGSSAIGSVGVSARNNGSPVLIQMAATADGLPPEIDGSQLGTLLQTRGAAAPTQVADLAAFEAAQDPDGMGVESNAYAVLALPDGGALVADAAGNDVLRVDNAGRISVFHVFANVTTGPCAAQFDPSPQFPGCNFVPTSLARDRLGNIYVGGLSSMVDDQAQVVKLDPSGARVLHTWYGFTTVTGVAVDQHDALYVSQLLAPQHDAPFPGVMGVLTKIGADGHRSNVDVPFPSGVAAGNSGDIYVAAYSIAPDTGLGAPGTSGQIWKLRFPR